MPVTPPKVTYKVWYQPKAEYDGPYQSCEAPGLHGTFPTLLAARGGYEACKRWFNEEKIVVEKSTPKGKLESSVRTIVHDNVDVWLEKYVDGFPTEEKVDPNGEKTEPVKKK